MFSADLKGFLIFEYFADFPIFSQIIPRATEPQGLHPDYRRELQVLLSEYYEEVLLEGSHDSHFKLDT